MDSDSKLELVLWPVLDGEIAYDIEQVQRHHGDFDRMVPFGDLLYDRTDAADHHVGVADRFDLVHIVAADDLVEAGVKVVQQGDHLKRRALEAQLGEANNVTEVNGHVLVRFGLDLLSAFELICNRSARLVSRNSAVSFET